MKAICICAWCYIQWGFSSGVVMYGCFYSGWGYIQVWFPVFLVGLCPGGFYWCYVRLSGEIDDLLTVTAKLLECIRQYQ